MKTTLKDIAEYVGVSVSTVSFVLNGKNRVGKDMKEKILKAVEELEYIPNKSAQKLKGNKFNEICLIISGPNYEYFSNPYLFKMVQGINTVLRKNNFNLTIKTTTSEFEEKFIKTEIKSDFFDGFILWGTRVSLEVFDSFFGYKVPLVSIARSSEHSFSIIIDDYKGGKIMTDYLVKKGLKNIAFLGKLDGISSAENRLRGYIDALKSNNVPVNNDLIFEANFYQEDGYKITKTLLKEFKGKFNAIFAASDLMAIGCMRALKEENIQIPQEIAVVGFDNIENSDILYKSLTTINTPILELGSFAAKKLLNLIEGKETKDKIEVLDVSLIIRETA